MPKHKDKDDDERFGQINWHPKFRRVPRQVRKVKIDKRFESMFEDPNFKSKHVVDKRGRPLARTSTEDLRRYYDISSSESENDEDDDEEDDEKSAPSTDKIEENEFKKTDDEEEESEEPTDKSDDEKAKEDEKIKIDLARGEGNLSSSSSDSSSEWEFEEDDAPTHEWTDIETNQAPAIENATSRLAICNLDWDKITARDILIVLNSFKPATGVIRSVKIYPSDFGLQRMSEEQKSGPVELREMKEESDDSEDEEEEEKSFLNKIEEERQRKALLEKLRQYEFNRLKYYYAVAECDSTETAEHVYSNCDGMEYETSGTRLDLRFIPDDMEFDDRKPKDEATSFGDLSTYRPHQFVNKALQQSRPVLTWEQERDSKRVELTRKAFQNPQEWDKLELNGVLASPSSSEASDEEEIGEKDDDENGDVSDSEKPDDSVGRSSKKEDFKKLLLKALEKSKSHQVGPVKEDDDVEMEIKWDPTVEEKLEKTGNSAAEGEKKLSQWEKYLEKRKEKRRQRKEEDRQKRLAVKRQRQGYDSDEDDFPSDFEDERETVGKLKKKRKQQKPESSEDDEDLEEKKKQAAELELLLAEPHDGNKRRHFNLKKLLKEDKKKGAGKEKKPIDSGMPPREDEEDFAMNLEDPRFNAIFNSHLYNIDPSDPAFKKTPGMKRLVEEKSKSKLKNGKSINRTVAESEKGDTSKISNISSVLDTPSEPAAKKTDPELSLLAKKLKAKTTMLKREKEQRSVKKLKN